MNKNSFPINIKNFYEISDKVWTNLHKYNFHNKLLVCDQFSIYGILKNSFCVENVLNNYLLTQKGLKIF